MPIFFNKNKINLQYFWEKQKHLVFIWPESAYLYLYMHHAWLTLAHFLLYSTMRYFLIYCVIHIHKRLCSTVWFDCQY